MDLLITFFTFYLLWLLIPITLLNGLFFKISCKKYYVEPTFLTATGYCIVISFFSFIILFISDMFFSMLNITNSMIFSVFHLFYSIIVFALITHYVFKFLKKSYVNEKICMRISMMFYFIWFILSIFLLLILKIIF
jgi:hypothetical protein